MGLSSFVLIGLLRLFHVLSNPLDTSYASSFPCGTYIAVSDARTPALAHGHLTASNTHALTHSRTHALLHPITTD